MIWAAASLVSNSALAPLVGCPRASSRLRRLATVGCFGAGNTALGPGSAGPSGAHVLLNFCRPRQCSKRAALVQ